MNELEVVLFDGEVSEYLIEDTSDKVYKESWIV